MGDLILMAIDRLRGLTHEQLATKYGGRREAVRKALKKSFEITAMFDFVFSANFPTPEETSEISARLSESGVPCPHAIFVGDCTDLPLWTKDALYYTYKRCCPSTHAIRVS